LVAARHLGVDVDQALSGANHRFETRFRHMERSAGDRGGLGTLGLDELEDLWVSAKAAVRD